MAHYEADLPASERSRLGSLADRLLRKEPGLATIPPFDGRLSAGRLPEAPSLHVEDHSGILYAHERGSDVKFSYRALALAGDGDVLAVSGPRIAAFESYCRETLGLGRVEVLVPAPGDPARSLSMACREDPRFVEHLARLARAAGGLNVIPYMATGGVWCLAGSIAERAGVRVCVAGPPPRLTRQVNDKIWFARRARDVLGAGALPPSEAVYGLVGLVGRLQRLARRSASVALKLTHSAASGGNLVLDSAGIVHSSPVVLRDRLAAAMRASGWREEYPIQVTAWEAPLVGSPSVQLWIPQTSDGPPLVEGVFDQTVAGRIARFSGARPSALPRNWRERIADESVRLATLFQGLGYYGRCSFDAVIFGDDLDRAELHWVECNGRWGGVSIPMTLANRLRGDWSAGGFLIATVRDRQLRVRDASELLRRFGGSLYRPGVQEEGAVLLCPGPLQTGRGIDLLFLGADTTATEKTAEDLLGSLVE